MLSVTSYRVNDTEKIIVKEVEYVARLSQIVGDMMTSLDGKRLA